MNSRINQVLREEGGHVEQGNKNVKLLQYFVYKVH